MANPFEAAQRQAHLKSEEFLEDEGAVSRRGAFGQRAGLVQRVHFGVRAAIRFVPAFADDPAVGREDDGSDPKHAKLKPAKKYRLNPGQAGIYQNGAIHSIDYPDYAKFVRVTGTNLDNINRMRVDLKTGEVHQMTPQQAT